ncbi:MAG: flagellar hook-basal body complex protein [bacterium]
MLRSLFSGVNGVRNHQIMMDVVANNIANVNTIGFKSGRITFSDAISQLLKGGSAPRDARGGSNPVQVGLGMKVQSIDNNFGQGGLEQTGYNTDLAIEGRGFFVVREGDKLLYTRAGNFTIDADGRLVANGGSTFVQGYQADANGELSDPTLQDLTVPVQLKTPANATTEVVLYSNLDSDATEALASLSDAGDSGVTSVSGTADDGVGGTHTIQISGTNATNSNGIGTSTFGGGGSLTLATTLTAAGVTDVDGFQVTVDQGTGDEVTYTILGLDLNSTVGELINQLNAQVAGAEFVLTGGEIEVTRRYAGDGTSFSVLLTDTGGTSDLVDQLFNDGAAGVGGTANFAVANGTASSLAAVDTFIDNATGATSTKTLDFVADSSTGLMTELTGLGRSGVSVRANSGFTATAITGNDLIIDTADTNHSTSITVYDEQGVTHNLTLTFTKTSQLNEWKWEASIPEPARLVNGYSGTVEFNPDGTLRAWNYDNNQSSFSFDPGTSQALVNIQFDPGTLGGMDGVTQTASSFSTQAISQDGYSMGVLEGIDIDNNGEITGSFTNGQQLRLGAIAIADFNNTDGLNKEGDNLWSATDSAGTPRYGLAQTNFGSLIDRGFLEMSNVDLVKEFTSMITAQRGFQASARVITTADQILQEVTNLKR